MSPFGSAKRAPPGHGALSNASAANWTIPSSGFGAFGNFSLTPTTPGEENSSAAPPPTTATGSSSFNGLGARQESRFRDVLSKDKPASDAKEEGAEFGKNEPLSAAAIGQNSGRNDQPPLHRQSDIDVESHVDDLLSPPPPVSRAPASRGPTDSGVLDFSPDQYGMSFGLPAGIRELVSDTPSSVIAPPTASSNTGATKATTAPPVRNGMSTEATPPPAPITSEPMSPTNTNPYHQSPPVSQRQFVMPDRMRWVYRDPNGITQGPWSGLEMHDWFKMGYFTPDLQVRRVEDEEFELLAQLIHRLGSPPEPFLLPQIGVAHGLEPSRPPSTLWSAGNADIPQPAFTGGGFPSQFANPLAVDGLKREDPLSFARQQEVLHRMQAQSHLQGGIPPLTPHHPFASHFPGGPGDPVNPLSGLSVGTPNPLQPGNANGGFFGSPFRGMPHPSFLSPDLGDIHGLGGFEPGQASQNVSRGLESEELTRMLDHLNVDGDLDRPLDMYGHGAFARDLPPNALRPQQPSALQQQSQQQPYPQPMPENHQDLHRSPMDADHARRVAAMLSDRARLSVEQDTSTDWNSPMYDAKAQESRLQQFRDLRPADIDIFAQSQNQLTPLSVHPSQHGVSSQLEPGDLERKSDVQLLAQQVQKAAWEQQAQNQRQQQQSPWAKVDTSVPMPFPPPQPQQSQDPQSPLIAPTAQRNRTNVAENLTANSQSRVPSPVDNGLPTIVTNTSAAAASSIAPWAKDASEQPKGPSLKEIQEAEALTAAKQEEIAAAQRRKEELAAAAAARRIAAAQESAEQQQALPVHANWANPSTNTAASDNGVSSVWGKSTNAKAPAKNAAAAPAKKKTLAEIQKEEEARKAKLAAAAAQHAPAGGSGSGGLAAPAATPAVKRYADLAGKMAQSSPSPASSAPAPAVPSVSSAANTGSGAWTTVGASGKIKAPAPAPASTTAATRAAAYPATSTASTAAKRTVTPAVKTAAAAAAKPASTNTTSAGGGSVNSTSRALEEITKWSRATLRTGLYSSINVDDFVTQLLILPAEMDIISDSVYAHSTTLDGRRFADEFIRRRKLADKGIVVDSGKVGSGGDNVEGWNEVAKKGQTHPRVNSGAAGGGGGSNGNGSFAGDDFDFRVVSKKKGKSGGK